MHRKNVPILAVSLPSAALRNAAKSPPNTPANPTPVPAGRQGMASVRNSANSWSTCGSLLARKMAAMASRSAGVRSFAGMVASGCNAHGGKTLAGKRAQEGEKEGKKRLSGVRFNELQKKAQKRLFFRHG